MTRLGHGALKLARDWVSPCDIVGSALNRLRAVLAPLQVNTQIPTELPLLYVHAALVEQALVNVLENAARFSPPHGRLQIEAGATDSEVYFAVSDEGPGIPEEDRAKIFDMFYTAARGDRGGQGTGLGLAICLGMIGAHGGRISVDDGIDGHGTCITLHLPLQTQPEAEMEHTL
jgi:two-component system sensor histidine kinase KdpD